MSGEKACSTGVRYITKHVARQAEDGNEKGVGRRPRKNKRKEDLQSQGVVPKFESVSEYLGRLGITPRFLKVGLGWGPRICISDKLPGETDRAGFGTILQESLF